MISVAMAAYNGAKYLEEQLDSIRVQSLPIDELIICDDGSIDSTLSIIEAYKQKYPDFPIQLVVNKKNLGYSLNFKKAMSLTKGDYIFLCDQDDLWFKDKVKDMIEIMETNPSILVLASSFVFMNEQGQVYKEKLKRGMSNNNLYIRPVKENGLVSVDFDLYLTRNFFQGCSLCIRKSLKEEVLSSFSDSIHHDWFINLIASIHKGMYFYNKPYFAYRIHSNNAVGIQGKYENTSDHIQKANSLNVRTQLAKEGLKVLGVLKKSHPTFYEQHKKRFKDLEFFYLEHIVALEQKRLWVLIKENGNKEYRLMKTRNARLMDILFTIKGKLKR